MRLSGVLGVVIVSFAEEFPMCATSVDTAADAVPLLSMSLPLFPVGPVLGANHSYKLPVSIPADPRSAGGVVLAGVAAVVPAHVTTQ